MRCRLMVAGVVVSLLLSSGCGWFRVKAPISPISADPSALVDQIQKRPPVKSLATNDLKSESTEMRSVVEVAKDRADRCDQESRDRMIAKWQMIIWILGIVCVLGAVTVSILRLYFKWTSVLIKWLPGLLAVGSVVCMVLGWLLAHLVIATIGVVVVVAVPVGITLLGKWSELVDYAKVQGKRLRGVDLDTALAEAEVHNKASFAVLDARLEDKW